MVFSFAISAFGYQQTMNHNQFHDVIHQKLNSLDLSSYENLEKTSHDIRELIKKIRVHGHRHIVLELLLIISLRQKNV